MSNIAAGELEALRALRELGPLSVLVVYEHVPRPDSSGADLRIHQVLETLVYAGHRVTFIGRNASSAPAYTHALEKLGVEVHAPDPERVFWERLDAPRVDLERLLVEGRFDVAILYQYFWVGISVAEQYLAPIRQHSPDTRVIVLSDDCHWLREQRRYERGRDRTDLERSRGLRAKELDASARADMVLTITAEDEARLSVDLPAVEFGRLHFCQNEIPDQVPGFDARRDLLFVGSGANDANVQAVRWFCADILPLVRRELPDVRLCIVGEEPRGGWIAGEDAGILVQGKLADLTGALHAARVFVSPITYGTGLKTKNVQALGTGLPMVATAISAEGMHIDGDAAAFVRDDPAQFAAAVVRLYTDRNLWQATSERSLEHAREHFSRTRVIADLTSAIVRLRSAPARTDTGQPGPGMLVAQSLPHYFEGKALPRRNAAHFELARELKRERKYEAAKQELRNVFCELCCLPPDAPLFAELHAQLAGIYLAAGEHTDAALAAEEALRLDPALAPETREVLERVRAIAHSSAAHREAIERNSDPAACIARLLDASAEAFAQGALEEALTQCIEAVGLDRRHARAWNDLGVILFACGDAQEALRAFDQALDCAPDYRDARINRARLHLACGERESAAEQVCALLERDASDSEALELARQLDPQAFVAS